MSASEKLEHAVPRTVDVHGHPSAGFVGIVGFERFEDIVVWNPSRILLRSKNIEPVNMLEE